MDARNKEIADIVAQLPLENEKVCAVQRMPLRCLVLPWMTRACMQVKVFYKETDDVRADLEMGGLGPGLTGEHTKYSYVVSREDTDGEEDRCPKSWVITHRYSSFHIFDKILLQIIKEEGGDETWLSEVSPVATAPSCAFRFCVFC